MLTRLSTRWFDATAVLLVALGTGAVLVGRPFGLAALGLAVVVAAAGAARRRRAPLSRLVTARVAVVAASVVAQLSTVAAQPTWWAVALGGALLAGLVAGERLLSRLAGFRPLVAANLPGVEPVPSRPNPAFALVLLTLLAAGVGLVVTALDWSSWWFTAAAALAVVPAVLLVAFGRERVAVGRRRAAALPAAVAAHAPRFIVYTSRPDDASYQVSMWLPYLERAGLPYLVVTRNRVPAEAIAALTTAPVVEARGLQELESLLCPSLNAVFYVNASSGNGALVRYQHLEHIYLGHGDSDKPPSYNPTHAMYDKIFVAGPAAIRRYAAHGVAIAAEHFEVVGRPQVETVEPVRARPRDEPWTVLYAPTWRGHVEETRLSSQLLGERIVAELLARGARVLFRPHPFSYHFAEEREVIARIHEQLDEDRRRSGLDHLFGAPAEHERDLVDCINLSDAMVSDVSSVASDYLFSGKPFALVAIPAEPPVFVEEYPVARASYVVHRELDDLGDALDAMLGPDPKEEERRRVRADYLGDFPAESYADAFVDAVRRHGLGSSDAPVPAGEVDREENENTSRSGGRSWRPVWRVVRRDLIPAVVALAALLLTVLPDPGRPAGAGLPAAITGVLALAAVFWVVQRNFRSRGRRVRTLGTGVVARVLVSLALSVMVWRQAVRDGGEAAGLLAGLTVAALLVTLVAERVLAGARGVDLVVADFPQAAPPAPPLLSTGAVPGAFLAAVGLALVLTSLGAPAWCPVALAVVPLLLLVGTVVRDRGRAAGSSNEERLHAALVELRPEFIAYFASTVGAAYQMGMWLPYFARIGRPFVIITRSVPMLDELSRTTRELGLSVPIIYRPTLKSLDDVIVPSLRAAFYVNNAVRNTHLIERRELTHVWLNHGDSEKPACFNPVHAIYDVLFVAGEAAIDRYARHGVQIPRSKFQIVGRPQVERIAASRQPVREVAEPTVLYAPTWKGPYADSRVYSLPVGKVIVGALLERGVRVVFRVHPFNHRYPEARAAIAEIIRLLAADRSATGRQHLWGAAAEREMTVEDCFNASDAMIADISAVVSDYLRSAKPFAMVAVGRSPEQLVVDAPVAQASYVLRDDVSNLDEVLENLLATDPLAEVREQTRQYYLGDIADDHYADTFVEAARRVVDHQADLPATVTTPLPSGSTRD